MEDVYTLISDEELDHSGIKGMKWGQRRYQNKDGTLTPAGKKRYNKEMEKIKAETQKVKNQQKTKAQLDKLEAARKNLEKLKKGEKEEDPNEDINAKKARILESRSAKELYDNANLFTTNELNAAKMRLELERSIKNLEPPTVDKGKEFTQKLTDKTETVAKVAQSGSKAYNSVAKIYNAFIGNKNDSALPLIDDSVISKLDKFKEDTEWIKAKNARREAERTSRKHDESDAKEVKKKAEAAEKEAKSKAEAAEKAAKEAQYRAEGDAFLGGFYRSGKKTSGSSSSRNTSETVSSGKSYTDKQLALPAPKSSSPQALAGKTYVDPMLALPAPSPQLALTAPRDDD